MLSILSCVYWLFVYFIWKIFELGCLSFLLLSFRSSIFILDINPYQINDLQTFLSHSVGCLFTLRLVSFFFNCSSFYFDAQCEE